MCGLPQSMKRSFSALIGGRPISAKSLPDSISAVMRPSVLERLTRHGRVVDQLVGHQFADELVFGQESW